MILSHIGATFPPWTGERRPLEDHDLSNTALRAATPAATRQHAADPRSSGNGPGADAVPPFDDGARLDGASLDDGAEASRLMREAALRSLDDAKAEDVVAIDIEGKSALADHMIVASGRSHRHVGAVSDRLLRDLKDAGFGAPRVEGAPANDWVLVDAGDVVVHIFRPEVREFYNLEKMWQVQAEDA